jgi:hypothetical protein
MRTDELSTVTDKQKKEIRSRCSICKEKGSLKNGLCEEHGLQRMGEQGKGGREELTSPSVIQLKNSKQAFGLHLEYKIWLGKKGVGIAMYCSYVQ